MSPGLAELGVYEDLECNFSVCEKCHEQLPEQLSGKDRLISEKVAQQKRTSCEKEHPLTRLKQPMRATCDNCFSKKICCQTCQKCGDWYCLTCSTGFGVDSTGCCDISHKLVHAPSAELCMECEQTPGSMLDEACLILLCEGCYGRRLEVAEMKKRIKGGHMCDARHSFQVACTTPNSVVCGECSRTTVWSFYCSKCNPVKIYCFRCRRVDVRDSCCFGDPWERMYGTNKCFVCDIDSHIVWNCEHCLLQICQQCR